MSYYPCYSFPDDVLHELWAQLLGMTFTELAFLRVSGMLQVAFSFIRAFWETNDVGTQTSTIQLLFLV